MLLSHLRLPTHHITAWNGTFWDDSSLDALGLAVHLHHPSTVCPDGSETAIILIGDINGFCNVRVCYGPLSAENTKGRQLLRHGFFPCSDICPKSAFTIAALEHFSLFGTLGKNSTHKFYAVLERLTKTGFPDGVSDRYRELALTHRKYSYIMALKRSGKAYTTHPNPEYQDSMAIQCVACPQPGINFKIEEVKENERLVFR